MSRPHEVPLTGGRITSGVVRVGDTVRRPTGDHSPFVHRLLRHYEQHGVGEAPRLLGTDDHGREILTFLVGDVPDTPFGRDWSAAQVTAAARLLRRLHDASAGTDLAGDEETVCHNDFHPMNCVFVDGLPRAVFDFDQAAPGERRRDVAYGAWLWLLGANIDHRLARQLELVRAFLDAYGLVRRDGFGTQVVTRVRQEHDLHVAAGRGATLGWLRTEIAWLTAHEDVVNSFVSAEVSGSKPS